jgi:hypothetical protein
MKAGIYNARINDVLVKSFYSVDVIAAQDYLEQRAQIVTLPDSVYCVECPDGHHFPVIISDERGGIGEEE